jgi:small subunit ribosomal protein S18
MPPKKIIPKKTLFLPKKKFCRFCVDRAAIMDWKNIKIIKKYLSDSGKIIPASKTGTCKKHQLQLGRVIKLSRHMALLPYHVLHEKV